MKKRKKKVTKKYQLEKAGAELLEQFRSYFNKRRNAKIAIIGSVSTADPTDREIRVRYQDGHEVILGDEFGLTTWTSLFDQLNKMHPKPVKDRDLS